ncbi:hypothetical protein G2W53_022555 [Senna tora]|uniref:DUF4283 domain-containing protein n=1 Tax=Senna tora TaxID=362788 RepID=A0A834TNV6_9FABA|nr:hypothetical protein G2W53_022555 [Senna tora]
MPEIFAPPLRDPPFFTKDLTLVATTSTFATANGKHLHDGVLLALDDKPNTILEEYKVHSTLIWVEFCGFPLEYYYASVANEVGNMVGDVMQVDF